MKPVIISASTARRRAISSHYPFKSAMADINNASGRGLKETYLIAHLNAYAINRLKSLGYNVYNNATQSKVTWS